jgi:prepilin peptidase CpaA
MLSPTSSDVVVMAVIAAGLAAAAIDLHTRRVPNTLTGAVTVSGLLIAASGPSGHGHVGIWMAVAGCLIGLLLMLPGHLLGATGGGDVKLLAALGTLLGPSATVTAFFFTAIAGGVMALAIAVLRRRLRQTLGSTVRVAAGSRVSAPEIGAHNTFAYAPAIAVGAALAAIGVF